MLFEGLSLSHTVRGYYRSLEASNRKLQQFELRHLTASTWLLYVFVRFCSRERLRRVLRKKHLQNYVSSTSSHLHLRTSTFSHIFAHLHIYIHNCASTSLRIFTASHRHLCSSSSSHIYISAHAHICTSIHLCSSSHPHIYHIFTSHLHLTSSPLALLNFLS